MGIWQTKFLRRKKYSGTPERQNTAFLQLISVLTDFVKFAMSTKKEQSNRPVRLLCSIRFSILGTASVPCKPAW